MRASEFPGSRKGTGAIAAVNFSSFQQRELFAVWRLRIIHAFAASTNGALGSETFETFWVRIMSRFG